jgi:pyrroline-5-carboxylate reductase
VRPNVAPDVAAGLRFREDHTVLSLIPVIHHEVVSRLVAPARRVFKVLPLSFVARHRGLVPYFPKDADVEALVAHLAEPLPVKDQRELHLLWAITGLISPFYALMSATQAWCVAGERGPECHRALYGFHMPPWPAWRSKGQSGFRMIAGEGERTPADSDEMAPQAHAGRDVPS